MIKRFKKTTLRRETWPQWFACRQSHTRLRLSRKQLRAKRNGGGERMSASAQPPRKNRPSSAQNLVVNKATLAHHPSMRDAYDNRIKQFIRLEKRKDTRSKRRPPK